MVGRHVIQRRQLEKVLVRAEAALTSVVATCYLLGVSARRRHHPHVSQQPSSVHPPAIGILDYEFEDWGGDDLLATFPALVVTERLRDALQTSGLTGFAFGSVIVSTTLNFHEFSTEPLPPFHRLHVTGHEGVDAMWIGERGRMIVNDQGMAFLRSFTLNNAIIESIT